VVSNPPYIAENDTHLSALGDEPQHALVSGADGLDAIRELVIGARRVLRHQGLLLLEHGYDQRKAVTGLLAAAGYVDIHCRKDLAGQDRVTSARLPTPDVSNP
jgi:release factor glutamine methyltransferase